MSDSNGQYQQLPPGWDCKYDQATGNCYYINYFTKAMQLEDPRMRYKQLQNERCSTESIPMQPVHGSPYHVYPSNNMPAMRAFQTGPLTNPSLQNVSTSPLLSSRGHLEMSPLPFPKSSLAQTPRLANMSRRSTIQETSFSNQFDTDAVVAKIQNMFPTASENHIRLLLKKYYNREAVVISALQVEKHPVTMPGPFVTPPAQRHLFHSNSAFYMTPPARRIDIGMNVGRLGYYHANGGGSSIAGIAASVSGFGGSTSRTASPIPCGRYGSVMSMHSGGGGCGGVGGGGGGVGIGRACGGGDATFRSGYAPNPLHGSPRYGEQWRSSPKPHSSPKMKLRYMKTIFPKADEMLLLDILAGADNNVQKASEKLTSMGYVKREFVTAKSTHRSDAAANVTVKRPGDEKIIPLRPKEYTQEEKDAMQARLNEKYPQIAERIILMALESVNYSEDRALQILQIVHEEDQARIKKSHHDDELRTDSGRTEMDGDATGGKNLPEDKNGSSQRGSIDREANSEHHQEFKSMLGRIATMGHNSALAKGPDEDLLLADYVTWNGANPDIPLGQKQIPKGPDASIRVERVYAAQGRNPELCKGPNVGLTKGSIYHQLRTDNRKNANIKCN